jgi:protein involved in polysaccharide export with SLBB domain
MSAHCYYIHAVGRAVAAMLCIVAIAGCVKRTTTTADFSAATPAAPVAAAAEPASITMNKQTYVQLTASELAQHDVEVPPPQMRTQIIYPGDHLELSIYEKLPVSQEKRVELKRVNENGSILVVPIGEVPVAGCILTDAQKIIEKKLAEYVITPFCEITIVKREYTPSVYVFGEVGRSGLIQIQRGDRILDVLSQVGGCKADAYRRSIKVVRLIDTTVTLYSIDLAGLLEKGKIEQNMLLRDQDIVYVPRRFLTTYQEVMQGLSGVMPWYFLIKGF